MATITQTLEGTQNEAIPLSHIRHATTEINQTPDHTSLAGADSQEQGPGERIDRLPYLKIMSAGFSFFVAGVNDGSIGALLPYVIREFHISTAIVSSV